MSITPDDILKEVEALKDNSVQSLDKIKPENLKLSDELLERLPDTIQKYIRYASPLSDVPDEFLLMPFIAHIGATIGRKRFIKLGGVTLYPVIWTVIFAGSSVMRKSTGLNLARKPFKYIEQKWKADYDVKLDEWKAKEKQAKKDKEKFDEPKPKRKTLYCSDGFSDLTFWQGLQDNGHIISFASEFTALWQELTRNRNGLQDLALQIFDADDSIRRNTVSGGDIELNNPIWCLAGATTLSAFQRSLTATERGSGLLQRILPVTATKRTKPYKALTELNQPDSDAYNYLSYEMEALIRLVPTAMNLSGSATEFYTQWSHQQHEKALSLERQIEDIGGYISRLDSYCLKFALIFQTLDDPDQPISLKNMQASVLLCEWLMNHIIFMLQEKYIFNRYYADRLKIRELLKRNDGIMSRTDLMNHSKLDKESLDRAIENDVEAGIIEKVEKDTGGKRPLILYRLLTPPS